jgi:uncharacterized metal-binding protein
MSKDDSNICSAAPTLLFPCSGAADVGEISDRAARTMTKSGAGKMFCLAGLGGLVPGIVKTAKEAAQVLAIDGCPLDCARLTLEKAGLSNFEHLVVTDLGLPKGQSPASEGNIETVIKAAAAKLNE